jgi:hypothetical protein
MRSTIAILAGLLALAFTSTASAVPGLHLVEESSGPPNSRSVNEATAECPAGQAMLGLGGKSEGGGGQVVLDALAARTGDSATVRAHEDQNGFAGNWLVKAFAICADDGGERRTTFNEPLNSITPKIASTEEGGPCTNQRRLTGVGAEVPIGATGQVVLDQIVPSADLETARVRAQEDDDGFAGNWSLRPFALCADPLPGLELVSATSPSNSQNKHATARCDEGKRVIGTGGRIFGGAGEVSIGYMIPDAALTRAHVRGVEDEDGRSGPWSVTAFAICANG